MIKKRNCYNNFTNLVLKTAMALEEGLKLKQLLDDALARKRQQCSHRTVYSHDIIRLWLESAIEEVKIPWDVCRGTCIHSY